MKIQSQKGKGTTVEIVIPAILEAPVEKTGNDTAKVAEGGNSVNSDANKKMCIRDSSKAGEPGLIQPRKCK